MDEIIPLHGKELYESVIPTSEICRDILTPRTSIINATKREEFSYGPHHRHALDIYTPSPGVENPAGAGNRPLLVFIYGGGFASGGKVFDLIPGDIVYKNLASFFAEEIGYLTAVVDYRLTEHGVRFPRGAEDLEMALEWLDKHYADQGPRDVYVMGNSAGGIHLTTWLFRPEFQESVTSLVSGKSTLKLRAAITLGCPFIWPQEVIDGPVGTSVKGYYGDEQKVKDNAALILVKQTLANASSGTVWPPILTLVSEFDPADIRDSGKVFMDIWKAAGHEGDYRVIKGHNHFSTVWLLRCGREREEKWGYDLGKWLKELK